MLMSPDTAQGVYAELSFALKEGWSFIRYPEGFRIKPPPGSQARADFKGLLESEVWRIAQFVHYRDFVSITTNEDGSYTVVSKSDSGNAFQIVFEIE